MSFDLERFTRVANLEQLETCGPNDPAVMAALPKAQGQYYPDGARAVIHIEDAPTDFSLEPQGQIPGLKNQHDFVQYLVVPGNGFRATSVSITHQWIEPPHHHSGRHKHLEAVVYAVEGEGYTEIQGEQVPWRAGDVLYVPPAMWEHEHTNDNPHPITQLRIQFGIRFWFTDIWPEGFTTQRIYDADGRPIEAGPIERERERS
jgi:mannose-6-phosphate isomerase-like protein (cupin superfamily)